jgi:large subunit ribosomal protein L25
VDRTPEEREDPMIQENIVVEVERRHETGKNAANRLRARDMIPAVIYGGGREMETLSLAVPRKSLLDLLRKGLHDNAIFKLQLKGTDQQRHVMIRDMMVDPVSRAMLHVDFVRILMDKKLRVKAAVEAVGVPVGVRNEGGLLNVVTHEIAIECLPADIPESVKIDVSEMKVHESIRISDLKLGDSIRILESSDRVIAHVGIPRAEEIVAPVVAATEAEVAAPAEPEVIKKGKKEPEEGAVAEAAAPAKPEKPEKAEKPERAGKGDRAEKKERK